MIVSMIAAMARNNIIGKDNDLPWAGQLPADMSFFIKNTKGKPVVMGRKTFDSIGKPLPNRLNIVITRDTELLIDGVIVVNSVEAAIEAAGDAEELMIIGGTNIYNQFIPVADRLYITDIDMNVIDGDATFPEIDSAWKIASTENHQKDEKNHFDYSFKIYEK